ncbi:hypothetical protein EHW97_09710 [Aeromicrobium camelliae]|uniref:Transmembrane protein n=1 Tax=Aeromicrobium camelliae TaxID=1538144 RepID=A0A3N6ZBE3_9ACTN|nr:hypothetical protein [Aeromicrobium camelliae]RQN07501.1 hypothetical protein EHW97_09710 [Aeromicrobium camelliae]
MASVVRQALSSWRTLATVGSCCAVAAMWYATAVLASGLAMLPWQSTSAGALVLVTTWLGWSAPVVVWVAALLVDRWATAPVRQPLLLMLAALIGIVGAVAPLWMVRDEGSSYYTGHVVMPLVLLCAASGLAGARMAYLTHPQLFRAPVP